MIELPGALAISSPFGYKLAGGRKLLYALIKPISRIHVARAVNGDALCACLDAGGLCSPHSPFSCKATENATGFFAGEVSFLK
jgi:hypothetical protein